MLLQTTLLRASPKGLFREAVVVTGGTLFFLFLAATLGLPEGRPSPHQSSAWGGTQAVNHATSSEGSRRFRFEANELSELLD